MAALIYNKLQQYESVILTKVKQIINSADI